MTAVQPVEISRQNGSVMLMHVPIDVDDQYIEDRIKELRELHLETERKRIETMKVRGESALPEFHNFIGWRRISLEEGRALSRAMKGLK